MDETATIPGKKRFMAIWFESLKELPNPARSTGFPAVSENRETATEASWWMSQARPRSGDSPLRFRDAMAPFRPPKEQAFGNIRPLPGKRQCILQGNKQTSPRQERFPANGETTRADCPFPLKCPRKNRHNLRTGPIVPSNLPNSTRPRQLRHLFPCGSRACRIASRHHLPFDIPSIFLASFQTTCHGHCMWLPRQRRNKRMQPPRRPTSFSRVVSFSCWSFSWGPFGRR